MIGRTDVGLVPEADAELSALVPFLPAVRAILVSPARRCVASAKALWPDEEIVADKRFWEQDFGEWAGRAYDDLPDVGALDRSALATLNDHGGESYVDLCHRSFPALAEAADQVRSGGGPIAVVAHAGIVRAGLSLALDDIPRGLAFEISSGSVTRLGCLPDGFSVRTASWRPG